MSDAEARRLAAEIREALRTPAGTDWRRVGSLARELARRAEDLAGPPRPAAPPARRRP